MFWECLLLTKCIYVRFCSVSRQVNPLQQPEVISHLMHFWFCMLAVKAVSSDVFLSVKDFRALTGDLSSL